MCCITGRIVNVPKMFLTITLDVALEEEWYMYLTITLVVALQEEW